MEKLIAYLNSIHQMSPELQGYYRTILKVRNAKKNDLIVKDDRENNSIFFLSKGWLRSYYINVNQKEVSFRFIGRGEMFTSFGNFIGIARGYEFVQALEDVEVYYITYGELEHIHKTFLEYNIITRILLERYIASINLRLYMLQLPTAFQRYNYLMEYYPELLQYIPNKYIASYLGITGQSLSRIRNRKK